MASGDLGDIVAPLFIVQSAILRDADRCPSRREQGNTK